MDVRTLNPVNNQEKGAEMSRNIHFHGALPIDSHFAAHRCWLVAVWSGISSTFVSRGAEGTKRKGLAIAIVWLFLFFKGDKARIEVTAFNLACIVLVTLVFYTHSTKSLCFFLFLFFHPVCHFQPLYIFFSFPITFFFWLRWSSHGILVSSRRTGSSQQSVDCAGQGGVCTFLYSACNNFVYVNARLICM